MNHDDEKLNVIAGLIAGFAVTLPMTAAMVLTHRRLPWSERYPLPPAEITGKVSAEAGVKQRLDQPEQLGLTLAAHFGYGAARRRAVCATGGAPSRSAAHAWHLLRTGGVDGQLSRAAARAWHPQAGERAPGEAQRADDRRARRFRRGAGLDLRFVGSGRTAKTLRAARRGGRRASATNPVRKEVK